MSDHSDSAGDQFEAEGSQEQQKTSSGQEKSLEAGNAQLSAVWDKTMKDKGSNGLPHRKSAVLLLTWDPSIDELKVGNEVKNLGSVFEDIYNYTVWTKCIKPGPSPQHQISFFLTEFLVEFDAKDTLLVVYYAGHGSPGNSFPGIPGQLILRYETNSQQRHNNRNSILWHQAEQNITATDADVLVIFDCCYAGNLARTRGHRSFEFMGATDSESTTSGPGPTSFTSALIWALKDLAKSPRPYFTTSDLQNKVREAPRFPKDQFPFLTTRHGTYFTRLVLAKVPKDGESEIIEYTKEDEKPVSPKRMVDLRLCFGKGPEEDEIVEVASTLKSLIDDGKLSAQRIQWLGYRKFPTPKQHAREGALWLLQRTRKKRAETMQSLNLSVAIPRQEHNSLSASPITPSSSEFGDYEDSISDDVIAEAKSGTVDANGVVDLRGITLHSPEASNGYDQLEAFRVPRQDMMPNEAERLLHHFKWLLIGIVNVALKALRQPELRWMFVVGLIVGVIDLVFSFWNHSPIVNPDFRVIRVVRVFARG